ncbi:MAG TPA: amino acid adenylation domain-containing protein, partial [Clostridia bacterium]|nr:amino acid adenylation domain-containing protein [Clostridia bacterium]
MLQQQLSYWRERLAGHPPVTELPTNRPRGSSASFRGSCLTRTLGREVMERLKHLASRHDATLFMVLLAAFKALVHRYTQQEDILVGSPIAGRTRVETEPLIGFFVNTLVLRTSLAGNPTFEQLLSRVREVILGAYAHQDLPFERLVEELQPERSLNHMPFTRLMFAVQNSLLEQIELPGVRFQFLEVQSTTSKFDLTLVLQETSRGLVANVEYNSDLFEADTVTRLLQHFETLLHGIVAVPYQRLSELPLLTAAERHQLLVEWNNTATEYPHDKSIQELFEAQVERTPDATAVVFGSQAMTYRELNGRANQVANYLRQFGICPDVPVGLCMRRSGDMVVGLLAILKAGGAYVPLDSTYPKERVAFMLADTRAPVVLTQQCLLSQVPCEQAKVICLDGDWELIARESRSNPPLAAGPESLAYITYTSGSTGQPKGVAVPHRAVIRLVINTNYIQLDATDRVAQVSNISFDAATFEIWGALLNGGQVIGITRDVSLSPEAFASELREQGITALFLTTALFNQLASEVPGAFATLRTVMTGGESHDPKWMRAVLKNGPPQRLANVYGPTENTTFTSYYLVREVDEKASSIPIGRPIGNTQMYILDPYLNPVPIGVPGELYAGGDGLARGYWNRPELTAEKFIPNPFSQRGPARLYKTGDLARYLPDGSIEFLGRRDHQVKIRGFRIELGEIEMMLGRHPAVREGVVTVVGEGAREKR